MQVAAALKQQEESHTVRLGFSNLIRSSVTAAAVVRADVARKTFNRLAMHHSLSAIRTGDREAL